MPIGNISWGDFSRVFINLGSTISGSLSQSLSRAPAPDQREQILFARDHVRDLRKALETIDRTWRRGREIVTTRAASTSSGADLGLGSPTSAYLESTEEINATPTSYSTHGPQWNGASTAAITIDGVYDGSHGTDTFTFKVNRAGTVGQDDLKIQVFNSLGDKLEDISIDKYDPLGTEYTLSSGLVMTIGEGQLVKNEQAALTVFDSLGSAVDPDLALDGVRLNDPDLQYGYDVTAGSFEVNGVMIAVGAGDTLNDVLARINASGAGVTATFSAQTEQISLVHDTPGSEGTITLGNDTSGFLAAAKLAGAALVEGMDQETDRLMAGVDRFSPVTAGDLTVNGVTVAFDPGVDTLQAVLDRVNASEAGVTAAVDATGRYVTFTAEDPGSALELDDGDTGFLAALDISGGTYDPQQSRTTGIGMTPHRAHRISGAMVDAAKAFNALYGLATPGQEAGSWLTRARQDLQTFMAGFLEETPIGSLAPLGIKFDGVAGTNLRFVFSEKSRDGMASAMLKNPRSAENLLFRTQSSAGSGLVDDLCSRLEIIETYLDGALGTSGVFVDTYA